MSRLYRWVIPDVIAPTPADRMLVIWDKALMGVEYFVPLLIVKGKLNR